MERLQVRRLPTEGGPVVNELDRKLAIDEVELHGDLARAYHGPSMTQTATLLLFLAGDLSGSEHATLGEFARKRHVSVVAPAPTPSSPYPAYRQELVLDLEGRLDEAQTLAASLDEARALDLLQAIERDLTQHPELPQAAWLLAEEHRIAAGLARGGSGDTTGADAHARAARALEGPRAAPFGVDLSPEQAGEAGLIHVRDLDPRDELELDGASGGAERSVEPGVHQARVLRAGELVFAEWVVLGTEREVTLGVRPLVPCSHEDLGAVTVSAGQVRGTSGVACQRYLVVRRDAGRLAVADCTRSACSGFTLLEGPPPPTSAGLPTWATVALLSAGAIAAATLATWAAGGFSRETAPEKTLFVYNGLK